MLERLPTRADWERDSASATPARSYEATLSTTIADVLVSIRTWYVPLERSASFQDPAVRDRLKLSVEDHVAEAIRLAIHEELPIDVAMSLDDDKTAYLAASVSMPNEKSIEQRFAASIERARGQAQVHPIGSISLVGADGDVISSFTAEGASMATTVRITDRGRTAKVRHPWAVPLLSVITLGIYYLVWYYKINREMSDWGEQNKVDIGLSPGMSVLAVTIGAFLIIPPFVSIWGTGKRMQLAQRCAGVHGGSGLLWFILHMIPVVSLLAPVYLQYQLNKVWETRPRAPDPCRDGRSCARVAEGVAAGAHNGGADRGSSAARAEARRPSNPEARRR